MADNIYEQVEIEDMKFERDTFYYPCPCGDMFEIAADDLRDGSNDIAVCPSCSLQIRIIYDLDDVPPKEEEVPLIKMEEQAPMAIAVAA